MNETKAKLDKAAELISGAKRLLGEAYQNISDADSRVLSRILIDLSWAVENCTVIGLHQIGEAVEDRMGE